MNRVIEAPVETVPAAPPSTPQIVAAFLLGAMLFGMAYTQAPLYFSNQNQYFLHGLAQADYGFLPNDWLANTRDPTPLFSALVAFTHRYLHDWFFYAYYVLIQGIYFLSLCAIAKRVAGDSANTRFSVGFMALFLLLHSALLRWASARVLGVDYPWYFQAGVAGQYVLGPVFQPSVFGVLLILSICLFQRDRSLLATSCAALAAVAHATYLLHAAILIAAYLCVLFRERRFRDALRAGLLALLLMLPAAAYNAAVFGPTSAETFARAQALLAHFRIPHHAEVRLWCDGITLIQVAWMFLGLFLVRGTRLFAVLAIPLAAAIGLTLLQLATDSDALALLFPWRASVYLVPIATTIVLSRLLVWVRIASRPVAVAAPLLLAVVVAGGALLVYFRVGYRISKEEVPVMEYVRDHKKAGDLYLVPFDLPDRSQARPGASSGDFKPPRSETEGIRRIAFGPQRFRLFTGAPVFVDLKSIPYRDVEVLEWRKRLEQNDRLYNAMGSLAAREEKELLRHLGVTHVIARADQRIVWPELAKIYPDNYLYPDDNFCIYRLVNK